MSEFDPVFGQELVWGCDGWTYHLTPQGKDFSFTGSFVERPGDIHSFGLLPGGAYAAIYNLIYGASIWTAPSLD